MKISMINMKLIKQGDQIAFRHLFYQLLPVCFI